MKLVADQIGVNGKTALDVYAIDEGGERLPYGDKVPDLKLRATRSKMAKGIVEDLGCSEEAAKAAVQQLYLKLERQIADADDLPPTEPSETIISARIAGLVDIVRAVADGSPVYLFITESGLVTAEYHDEGGVRHVPPETIHFPYLLCSEDAVRAAYREDTDEPLFTDLFDWHMAASRLPSEGHYQLTALFALLTWLADQMDYAPYICLESKDPERGKTRWGQALAWVSYRGIHTETLQEANLFRWSDSLQATMFFDVKDLWRKAEKRGAEDILLSRFQRNRAKVARVLDPQAGPFKGVTYFDCYGPTILAINESLHEPLASRTLGIVPPEASGKYETVREVDALPLKARCAAFRARHLLDAIPQVDKPANGRLGDIMQPLAAIAQIVGGGLPDVFPRIVVEFRSARQAARSETNEARLVAAVQSAVDEGGLIENVIPTAAVLAVYNTGLPDQYQLSERQIGVRLHNLGFFAGRVRDAAGHKVRGRLIDQDQLSALGRKFGLGDSANFEVGHDMAHSAHTVPPVVIHDWAMFGPSDHVESENVDHVDQHGPHTVHAYATPGGPSGPSDVQGSKKPITETSGCAVCGLTVDIDSMVYTASGDIRHEDCEVTL